MHNTLSDSEFLAGFKNAKLSDSLLTDEAYLRLIYLYINMYPSEMAGPVLCTDIAIHLQEKNSESWFKIDHILQSIEIVNDFMIRTSAKNFIEFITEFPILKYGFKSLFDSYRLADKTLENESSGLIRTKSKFVLI